MRGGSPHREDPAQSRQTAPSHQIPENGLCPVVHVVCSRHCADLQALSGFYKDPVPLVPCRLLHRPAAYRRECRSVDPAYGQGYLLSCAQLLYKCAVFQALLPPDPVLDVDCMYFIPQLFQCQQKTDRVRAA